MTVLESRPLTKGPVNLAVVLYVTWMISLFVCVAVWTIAQSFVVLQSSNREAALLIGPLQQDTSTISQSLAQRHGAFFGHIQLNSVQASHSLAVVADCTRHLQQHRVTPMMQQQQQQQLLSVFGGGKQAAAVKPVDQQQPNPSHIRQGQQQIPQQQASQKQRQLPPPPAPQQQQEQLPLLPEQQQQQQQQEQLPPEQQQQQQGSLQQQLEPLHQHRPQSSTAGPVDIVYLWVNGSDPVLQEELAAWTSSNSATSNTPSPTSDEGAWPNPYEDTPTRGARFDSGRDELRFSIRSLQAYMPWYRHLYIVTNGQVPTWLYLPDPRVRIVPHTTIFLNASDLPTFNSNAIQANLLNIPGLSENFILMDDDFFLTAPWTMSDFVGPDGGQVVTGSTVVETIAPENKYLQSLVHTNEAFTAHFGHWHRFDPSHTPRLVLKHWLRELHAKMPDVFRKTSSARVRSPTDLALPPAYQWYVSQFQPGQHPKAPENATAFVSINDETAGPFLMAALQDLQERIRTSDSAAAAYMNAISYKTGDYAEQTRIAAKYEAERAKSGISGVYVMHGATLHLHSLIAGWSKPGAKVVCLNDDIPESAAAARPLVNPIITGFLQARYSEATDYELAWDDWNECSGRLKTDFGELPTAAHFAAACGGNTNEENMPENT